MKSVAIKYPDGSNTIQRMAELCIALFLTLMRKSATAELGTIFGEVPLVQIGFRLAIWKKNP
mgnify:CR=1 FL=1